MQSTPVEALDHAESSERQSMVCPPVRRDNVIALASVWLLLWTTSTVNIFQIDLHGCQFEIILPVNLALAKSKEEKRFFLKGPSPF